MGWVSLSESPKGEKPRRLTEEEIEGIITDFPAVSAAETNAGRASRDGITQQIRSALLQLELSPTAIPLLKERLRITHNNSRVHPGTAVGMLAAASVSASATQATLNTFKEAGQAPTGAAGIDVLERLLFASPLKPENKMSFIHFREHLNYEAVMEMRSRIVGSTVQDLLDHWIVDSPESLPSYWWTPGNEGRKLTAATITKKALKYKPPVILRIYLNTNALYSHKVSLGQIASVLTSQTVTAYYGPMVSLDQNSTAQSIIDLYPTENVGNYISTHLKEKDIAAWKITYPELTFFSIWVEKMLATKVKGISGIRELYPTTTPIWQVVQEQKVDDGWEFHLNRSRAMDKGIGVEEVAKLLKEAFRDATVTIVDNFTVKARNINVGGTTPGKFIQKSLNDESSQRQAWLTSSPVNKVTRPPPELYKWENMANYVTAVASGGNLPELLALPGVDQRKTRGNDMHEIADTLGIEAAWAFRCQALNENIQSSRSYVNPTHLMLLTDFLMQRGIPLGIARELESSNTPITVASQARAVDVISKSALRGGQEPTETTSSAIAAGRNISVGTGFADIGIQGAGRWLFNDEVLEQMSKNKRAGVAVDDWLALQSKLQPSSHQEQKLDAPHGGDSLPSGPAEPAPVTVSHEAEEPLVTNQQFLLPVLPPSTLQAVDVAPILVNRTNEISSQLQKDEGVEEAGEEEEVEEAPQLPVLEDVNIPDFSLENL